ncbi:MAG TPA: hypothetical protein VGD42_12935 [Lysobacter sp.]
MPESWIPARALLALLVAHATALCIVTAVFGLALAGNGSRVGAMVPIGFCVLLVAGAIAVYFAACGLQRRGRHDSAAMLTGAYVIAPPVALACFLY